MKEELSRSYLSSLKKQQKENETPYKLYYDLQYFVSLDCENKICFDCGGPFPTYVSINNGVFICSNCAKNHEKLGYNISFIHQISAPWDPYLLSYAIRGGNNRFKRLCIQFEVPCQSYNENDEEKINKYIIRLGEYHRLLLRSEIYAEEPPKPLYFEESKKPCLNNLIFPEFQNYHLYKGEVVVPGKTYSIGGKIWNATKATAGIVGTAGGLAYKAGKPVVCFLGGAAFKGAKYLGSSILNHYKGTNNDDKTNNNINNNKKLNNKNNLSFNNNKNDNFNGNYNINGFALVDYPDEDLCQIKTVDLNSPKDKGNFKVNYNININNNNMNMQNMQTKMNNNGIINSQMGNLNNHNNIIANDNYLMNNGNNFDNININNTYDYNSSKNINIININNKSDLDGFEILSNTQDKDHSSSSNSCFENNSFAGMDVQFENTDKEKARQDANNFLLAP